MKRLALVLVIGSSFSMYAAEQLELKEADQKRRTSGTEVQGLFDNGLLERAVLSSVANDNPSPETIKLHKEEIERCVKLGIIENLRDMSKEDFRYPYQIRPLIKKGIERIQAFELLQEQAVKAKEALNTTELYALMQNMRGNAQLEQQDYERAVKMLKDHIGYLEVNQAHLRGDLIQVRIMQKKYPHHFSHDVRRFNEKREHALFETVIPCNDGRHLSTQGILEEVANAECEENVKELQAIFEKVDKVSNLDFKYRYKILIQASIDRVNAVLKKKEEVQRNGLATQEHKYARARGTLDRLAPAANNGWFASARSWFARPAIKIASAAATFVAGFLLYKKYAGRSEGVAAR